MKPIHSIPKDLINIYLKITEEELEVHYDELKKVFDITQPLFNFYKAVGNLCEISVVSKLLYTKQQKLG